MGQEHSAPVSSKRTPNRLSKPRTNNSALNLLSRSALHLDRKDAKDAPVNDVPGYENRYSVVFASPEVRLGVAEEEKKESKRRSIFRNHSTPNKQLDARIEKAIERNEVYQQNEIYQWSDQTRKSSIADEIQSYEEKARPQIRSRMSLQHVPTNQSQQRLSLVAEVLTPAEEPTNRISTYGELRSPSFTNPVFTRTTSETEIYPMRRRSLQQHGVATRPVLPNDARQSLPSQTRTQPNTEDDNFSRPSPYPLAYLASLKQQDMPRVETPDELNYRHTGAFKLGSLVVTNGYASPTPSIERAATMGAGEDYITAGNMRKLGEGHRRGMSSRSNTMVPAERKSPWVVNEGSPLRNFSKYDALSPKLPDLDRSLADFDFDYSLELQKHTHSPSRSRDLADEYIEEISSPYSFVPSRTPSPRLEPTSKHTALEDELFAAEPLTPSLSHAPSTADSGYGGTSRKSSAVRQKPLAKADSGYSSNISLRSFRTNGSKAPPVPAKDPPRTPPRETISRVPSSAYSYNSSNENSVTTRPSLPASSTADTSISTDDSSPPATPKQQTFKPDPRRLSGADGLRSHPSKTTKHSRTGSEPKPLGVSKLLSYKKEKTRPYSIQPQIGSLFTQSQRRDEPILTPPPVSSEAFRRLEGRDSIPSFASPFGLHKNSSKETLGTIFSVGSGFSEFPVLTQSRLQEALPPTPLRKAISMTNTSSHTSNSYCPPKTPPRKLQKKPSVQDMVAYGELDLSVTRSSSYQNIRVPIEDTLKTKRSYSVGSQMEQPKVEMIERNVSGESWANAALISKPSYSSITAMNPFDSRKSSLDSLPSRQAERLSVEQEPVRRLSWGSRDKKQPPVSMQTQRKVTPAPQPAYKLFPSPPRPAPAPVKAISKDPVSTPLATMSKVPPKMAFPDRPPPPPPKSPQYVTAPAPQPHQDSPRPDPWAEQKAFWAERRNSASSLNQERPELTKRSSTNSIQRPDLIARGSTESIPTSVTNRNSTSTFQSRGGRRPPSVHQNANLRIQKNMEAVKARMYMENKLYMQSVPNLRDEQERQNRERDKAGEMLAGWAVSPGGTTPGEYHHTYGFQIHAQRPPSPEKEYFSQAEEGFNFGDFHHKQNSTADMLMLDRLPGDYGYVPGYRAREEQQQQHYVAVDFSNVPVLRR